MDGRDYVAEMRKIIDHEADGEYVSGLIAAEIVGKLRANDQDLLAGWLDIQAVSLIHQAINDRDRSRRTRARTAGPRSVFAQAAESHEQGDSADLCGLLETHYVVNGDNLRKPLSAMGSTDLTYVSNRYLDRAQTASMECVFFQALARKVGSGTVGDHFTEGQLQEMRNSL